MADFSELCPLFNTGIYHELLFPNMDMDDIHPCGNALVGTLTASASGDFSFGRTVVVTAAWVRKVERNSEDCILRVAHHSSRLAAGTIMASLTVSVTLAGHQLGYGYIPMVTSGTNLPMTFTSAAVLGFSIATQTSTITAGHFDLIVRYRDK